MELTHKDVLSILPDRDPEGHKGTYGRVLLLCGSMGYTGAPYLAAMGALRSGAGLVYLCVPQSIYSILAVKLNEAIVIPLPDEGGKFGEDAIQEIAQLLPKMDAVLIGCGMGQSPGTSKLVEYVLNNAACPIVLDADGINTISAHKDMMRGNKNVRILTPHDGEFARLGYAITGDRMTTAKHAARELQCILLLKGHRTCITDGKTEYINPTGNPGMAVGGSGDLLAGIIVSLLGQHIPPMEAAACGAFLHGAAGDVCAMELGQYGMLPTDMLNVLPRLMK